MRGAARPRAAIALRTRLSIARRPDALVERGLGAFERDQIVDHRLYRQLARDLLLGAPHQERFHRRFGAVGSNGLCGDGSRFSALPQMSVTSYQNIYRGGWSF